MLYEIEFEKKLWKYVNITADNEKEARQKAWNEYKDTGWENWNNSPEILNIIEIKEE
jgi:hypothetical protein